ncbi:MAG: FtsX-like permease family protein [Candidatus Babeliales bacterium]
MNYQSFYLAWRYMKSSHTEKTIALMTKLCFCGIVISTFSLTLVLFVMRGFEKETHAKLQGVHAHIIMRGYGQPLNYPHIAEILSAEFREIQAFSPTSMRQVLVQTEEDEPQVVIIKGIDPAAEATVSSLRSKIIGQQRTPITLADAVHDDHLIIGSQLAKTLDVMPGDSITLLFAESEKARSRKIIFDEQEAIVSGIFTTGIDEFDAGIIICSLPFLNQLFPDAGIDQINLTLASSAHEHTVVERLKKRFDLEVYSWKDLYPALVSALKLEKYAMLIIFALIALVASMSIISLLFMQITQKRGDIAILKAMGTSNSTIASIFLIMGMSIAFVSCMCGIVLALGAGWFLQQYPLITLPDVYYVSHIPVTIEWHLIAMVIGIVMLLSFIATWIPAQKARSLIVAHVLRFEA